MWAAGALRGAPASTTSDRAARPGEDQGRGQAGGAPADDHDVVSSCPQAAAPRHRRLGTLLFLGIRSQMASWRTSQRRHRRRAGPGRAPAQRLRTQRAAHAHRRRRSTGISKSTLSRLETGERRPTLELLLALSHAYRVPLDDLVAAPEEGDPRIRLSRAGSRAGP